MAQYRTQAGTLCGGPPDMVRRFLAQGAQPVVLRSRHSVPSQGLGRKARVLAVVHGWMPALAAGSERMMQHLLAALPAEEFDVSVLSFGISGTESYGDYYEYEGVPVQVGFTPNEPPDVVITHHGPGARVVQDLCTDYPEARVAVVYHNERYDIPDIKALNAELSVFNTEWVGKILDEPGIVVHPPLEPARHFVPRTGKAVTLVNLQKNKGIRLFEELATRMPDVPFLGVLGTHGQQETRRLEQLPNVEIHPVTQDMREVWQKSRVVLMPSGYESFGMVAAEACVSGIPVMANPTAGLVECLDEAGLFHPRDNPDAWEKTLRLLLTDREHYRVRSEMALIRGQELAAQTQTELAQFVQAVRGLV